MDAKTLEALKGSIRKWELICWGLGKDTGSENCPLCERFSKTCFDCPVYEKTGTIGCSYTPYVPWDKYWDKYCDFKISKPPNGFYSANSENIHLALAELDFLLSLLPKSELKKYKERENIGVKK